MSEKKVVVIKENIGIVDYSAAVLKMAEGFFNEDGDYCPHFGRINSVGVFYAYFTDGKYFGDDVDIDTMIADEELMNAYNSALYGEIEFRLNFQNAYEDAMDIVRHKTYTITGIIEAIKNLFVRLADTVAPVLTEENIEKLTKISEEITDGKLNADAIVEAFGRAMKQDEAG